MDNLIDYILDEVSYSGIKRKQKSIHRLFPEFGPRVSAVGDLGGIRLVGVKKDWWHFKIHSGTDESKWYDASLNFKDMQQTLERLVKDRRLWNKAKTHVDYRKLATAVMQKSDIQLSCSCPAFKYYGSDYILSQDKYDGKHGDKETRAPNIRNPKQYGAVCKHLQTLLNVFKWYDSTMAKFLKDHYARDIQGYEKEVLKDLGQVKQQAAALGDMQAQQQAKEVPVEEPLEQEDADALKMPMEQPEEEAGIPPANQNKPDRVLKAELKKAEQDRKEELDLPDVGEEKPGVVDPNANIPPKVKRKKEKDELENESVNKGEKLNV